VDPLEKLVAKGDKDTVRSQAIHALGEIGGLQGRAALRRIVREGSEPQDRSDALGMLVKLKEVMEVKDLLKGALDDLDGGVRQQAVVAIREFNLKSFEQDLFPRMNDASEQVILEAIRAFGALGTHSAVDVLVKVLVKPDPEAEEIDSLQRAANLSLEQITGLKQGYDDTNDVAKQAAIDGWRIWWKKNKDTWK
jgi:HEAT repeat protein